MRRMRKIGGEVATTHRLKHPRFLSYRNEDAPSVHRCLWSHSSSSRRKPRQLPRELIITSIGGIDFLIVVIIAAIIYASYFRLLGTSASKLPLYLAAALLAATVFVAIFERLGGYRLPRLQSLRWQVSYISLAWLAAVSLLMLTAFIGRISSEYSRGWSLLWFTVSPLGLMSVRLIEHGLLRRSLVTGALARNLVVVGASAEGQKLVGRLRKFDDPSFVIRGIFDDRRSRRPPEVEGMPVLGTTDDLLALARQERINEVVVALPLTAEERLAAIFEKLTAIPADLSLSIAVFSEQFPIRGVASIANTPVLAIVDQPLKHGRKIWKWLEDKLIATLILVLVSPVFALIAVLIKLDSPGPVFFIQPRFGFNNNVIRVLKFRTMYCDLCDHAGGQRTVLNDPRVTRVGRILRSLSFDELPQLINVLKGEMALVGPRPHAVSMKAGQLLYHEAVARYPHRHRVKPGITGWAQVNGFRGEVDTLEKARGRVEHDLYYINHWSLWFDFRILLRTIDIVISRTNAY